MRWAFYWPSVFAGPRPRFAKLLEVKLMHGKLFQWSSVPSAPPTSKAYFETTDIGSKGISSQLLWSLVCGYMTLTWSSRRPPLRDWNGELIELIAWNWPFNHRFMSGSSERHPPKGACFRAAAAVPSSAKRKSNTKLKRVMLKTSPFVTRKTEALWRGISYSKWGYLIWIKNLDAEKIEVPSAPPTSKAFFETTDIGSKGISSQLLWSLVCGYMTLTWSSCRPPLRDWNGELIELIAWNWPFNHRFMSGSSERHPPKGACLWFRAAAAVPSSTKIKSKTVNKALWRGISYSKWGYVIWIKNLDAEKIETSQIQRQKRVLNTKHETTVLTRK